MLLGMGLFSFIGARIFNVFINFDSYKDNFTRIFSLNFEGFSLYGGALFAIISGLFIARYKKINLLKFADTAIPFVGIGIAIMRIGCFLNGCCFGKETNFPWGVKFPFLSPAHIEQISGNILNSTSVHRHFNGVYNNKEEKACRNRASCIRNMVYSIQMV
jgi:phosphatidylglycerol:prolipoprotein diacylglycerol transferase